MIYFVGNVEIILEDCRFLNNLVDSGTKGILIVSSYANITGCWFVDEFTYELPQYRGRRNDSITGQFVSVQSGSSVSITDSVFTGGYSADGGAIALIGGRKD